MLIRKLVRRCRLKILKIPKNINVNIVENGENFLRTEQKKTWEDAVKQKKYYQTHKEERAKKMREYYNKNGKIIMKKQAIERRIKCLTHYSNGTMKCACPECYYHTHDCPTEFLTIDHINPEYKPDKTGKNSRSRGVDYRWLIDNDFPEGFQILCWNCNCSKGKYGSCSHNERESCNL